MLLDSEAVQHRPCEQAYTSKVRLAPAPAIPITHVSYLFEPQQQ